MATTPWAGGGRRGTDSAGIATGARRLIGRGDREREFGGRGRGRGLRF